MVFVQVLDSQIAVGKGIEYLRDYHFEDVAENFDLRMDEEGELRRKNDWKMKSRKLKWIFMQKGKISDKAQQK